MGVPLRPVAARSVYRGVAPPPALADVLACGWEARTSGTPTSPPRPRVPPPVRLLPAALVRVAEKSQTPPAAPGPDQRPDGTLVADVASVSGLLDLDRRRLLPDPGAYWRGAGHAAGTAGAGAENGVIFADPLATVAPCPITTTSIPTSPPSTTP
ncbi:hypothetical protein [Amycolatopsis sp. Hca4]|uniref:hypothetical protein n=1 Tax=Amycolatopsis sp. Hca4 TaxID=2742131 RepID=UPI0034CFD673